MNQQMSGKCSSGESCADKSVRATRCQSVSASAERHKQAHELDYSGPYGDKDQRGHHEQDQRDDHLDRGFGGLLFGALASFGAQGIGVNAKGLGHAGSEAVGLDQGSDERANIFHAGAGGQIAKRFDARLAGAGFEVEEVELGGKLGVSVLQIFADAIEGLVEGQSGFDADDGEVERIGKSEANTALALLNFLFQQERGMKKPKAKSPSRSRGESNPETRKTEKKPMAAKRTRRPR